MNAHTSPHFKSTVYPWGMEPLVLGREGNCLFLWPAAKGEKVNWKRYESFCPLRWWILCKLEEEAFQSQLLLLFALSALNHFLSFAPLLTLSSLFSKWFFCFCQILYPCSICGVCMLHGCAGWQVQLRGVRRAKAAFAECRKESWGSTAFGEKTACSRN